MGAADDVVEERLTTRTRWNGSKTTVGRIATLRMDSLDDEPIVAETWYFIRGLDLPTSRMLDASLAHWRVETMRRIFDDSRSFDEDRRGIHRGNAPENLSLMRKLVIAVTGLHGATCREALCPSAELHFIGGPPDRQAARRGLPERVAGV